MTHLETELNNLKIELNEMWALVLSQVKASSEALISFDKDAASEILFREKMVDVYELKLDRDCENIIALYNPVASDLRLTLAIIRIVTNLERIADFAKGIAKFVVKSNHTTINPELIKASKVEELLANAYAMLNDAKTALENENSRMAMSIFSKDTLLDEITKESNDIIGDYILKHTEEIDEALSIHSIIRKIERMGDHSNNIAEEIVFYIDAKVLKHNKAAKK
ncbi:MAG: phosphate signaling complex protein PhoU [Bacteroidetes bacterium]|nr:phosphate signaling complex protein PhoU [Bacteroidota bacterium]